MKKLTFLLSLFLALQVNAQSDSTYCSMCQVKATINQANTSCLIQWERRMGGVEDDGIAEDYFAWLSPGGLTAVKYPDHSMYPLHITGGEIYLGDGSFPEGADLIGKQYRACVFDDDGPNDMPGTLLDSVTVTVDHYHWVAFDGLDVVISEGNFYLAVEQLATSPDCPPVGVDLTEPVASLSYVKAVDSEWQLSSYQDFMIRYFACQPWDAAYNNNRINENFGATVALVKDFDTLAGEGPEDGMLITLDSNIIMNVSYEYTGWQMLEEGYYAFAVKQTCLNEAESEWEYTGIVEKKTIGQPESDELITALSLFPNPFSHATVIEYALKQPSKATVAVFNHLGDQVYREHVYQSSGKQRITWQAGYLPTGLYYLQIESGGQMFTRKMVLMK